MIVEVVRLHPSDQWAPSRIFDEMGDRANRLEEHLSMVRPITTEILDDCGRRLFGFVLTEDPRENRSLNADCDLTEWSKGCAGSVVLRMTDANGLQAAVRATIEPVQ